MGVLVVGVGGWFAMGGGESNAAYDPDLTKVAVHFDQSWAKGDLQGLLSMTHPDKTTAIEINLEGMIEQRGWTDGFAAISATAVPTAGLDAGDMAAINKDGKSLETGIVVHDTADGQMIGRWQFSNARERWYLYELELPSPDLGPRLAAFEAAWNGGDTAEIRKFMRQEKRDELLAAFAKIADRDGWKERFPTLKASGTDPGDLKKLATPGFSLVYPTKAKASYDTAYGRMTTNWRLDRTSDNWYLRSFKPPK